MSGRAERPNDDCEKFSLLYGTLDYDGNSDNRNEGFAMTDAIWSRDQAAAALAQIGALEHAAAALSPAELGAALERHLWSVKRKTDEDPDAIMTSDEPGYTVSRSDLTIAGVRRFLAELRFLDTLVPDQTPAETMLVDLHGVSVAAEAVRQSDDPDRAALGAEIARDVERAMKSAERLFEFERS